MAYRGRSGHVVWGGQKRVDMNYSPIPRDAHLKQSFIRLSPEEKRREDVLRERFAAFWSAASGEPRAIYDTFIAGTPLSSDVRLDPVDSSSVKGWWVRPARESAKQAILFLHGGGYVMGSASAYRG